jgi:hypothetical protein
MKIPTLSLQKTQNVNQLHSIFDKSIPQGFMTLETFSKMLDDKITTHYEKKY